MSGDASRTERTRRSTRLAGYDYTLPGAYFVTVCAYRRESLFDDVEVIGVIEKTWLEIPEHFRKVQVDAFVIMPNQVHGIVVIDEASVGAWHAKPLRMHGLTPGSLGAIIASFKSSVSRRLRELQVISGPAWQRNYYDRIIRNEEELNRIREYIALNPLRWHNDYDSPHRISDAAYERDWNWLEKPEHPAV